jgi:uncharacterized protein involved in type VI secretion and phage assembly
MSGQLHSSVAMGLVTAVRPGQVKLEFPWLDDEYRSNWVPIATVMSGKERGSFLMPEVGDQVLVGFEHGHIDHPCVIGFMWNGAAKPKESDVQNRVIRTPGGHELRFEDRAGSRKVVLISSDGHRIELDDSPAGKKLQLTSKNGLTITLDDKDASIELRGGGRILALRAGAVQIS